MPVVLSAYTTLMYKVAHSEKNSRNKNSRILFLGSGSSMGTPNLIHLMTDAHDPKFMKNIEVSRKAAVGDPRNNKNYRCNPSILVQHNHDTPQSKNIIIDMGTTFT